jgi:hypothetical protein
MSSESIRIADQLRRAVNGDAWHGPSVREVLEGVTAAGASEHPVAGAHSIWELAVHIDAWVGASLEATEGVAMPWPIPAEMDWPPIGEGSSAWTEAKDRLFATAERFAKTVESFSEARLRETVPGRDFDFYFLFHGVVQHSLYHAGQIALLKKELAGEWERRM